MRVIILSIILILHLDLHSQEFQWIRAEEINYEFNPGMLNYVVEATADNTVWFSGMIEFTEFYQEAMGDLFLKEYDAQGNTLHEYIIEGSALVSDVAASPGGDIYLAGQYRSDLLFPGGYHQVFTGANINSFLARITENGETDWVIDLEEDFPNAVIEDINIVGDYILVAHSEWLESNISRYDLQGNLVNSIRQQDVGIVSSIATDGTGNIYAAGSCAGTNSLFGGVPFSSPFQYNMYLVKYNEAGNPEWVEFVEDITCTKPRILSDMEGNITWSGALNLQAVFDSISLQGPSWVYDLFITRFNSFGHVQWGLEVPQVTTGDATVNKLSNSTQLPDGSVVVGGLTRGTIEWGNGVISDVGGINNNLLALSVNEEGMPFWVKTGGGDGHSTSMSITSTPDGNIYQAGIGHSTITFDTCSYTGISFYYPFLVKLTPANPTAVPPSDMSPESLHLFPNPVKDHLKIRLDGKEVLYIRVYNSQGNMIMEVKNSKDLNTHELPGGLYFLEVETAFGIKYPARFVKVG